MGAFRRIIHAPLNGGHAVQHFFNPGGTGRTGHAGNHEIHALFINGEPGFTNSRDHSPNAGLRSVQINLSPFGREIDGCMHAALPVQNFFDPGRTGCASHSTNWKTDCLGHLNIS